MPETALVPAGMEAYVVPTGQVIERNTLPYVQFYSTNSKNAGEIAAQVRGIQQPEPIIFDRGKYRRLNPFKFHLVESLRVWVERDSDGAAVSVLRDDPGPGLHDAKEEIHALLIVYTSEGLVPATCTFKGGACKGMVAPNNELIGMRDPAFVTDWMAQSADHKAAAGIPLPFARFTVTLNMALKVAKVSGFKFRLSSSVIDPTTVGDYNELAEFLKDSVEELNAVRAFNLSRVEQLLTSAA